MIVKAMSLFGMVAVGGGLTIAAIGTIGDDVAVYRWGVIAALGGLAALAVAGLALLRRQGWVLARLARAKPSEVAVTQADLERVVRRLDARVLGWFEMAQRQGDDGAD